MRRELSCVCSAGGHCPQYNRAVTNREQQLCAGTHPNGRWNDLAGVQRRRWEWFCAAFPDHEDCRQRSARARVAAGLTPQTGPGTEFEKLCKAIKVHLTGCGGCADTLAYMNALGPDGCRAHLDEIEERIKANKRTANLGTAMTLAAMKGAVLHGCFSLRGLIKLAIERAEKQ